METLQWRRWGGDGETTTSDGKAKSQVVCAEKRVLGGEGKLAGRWECLLVGGLPSWLGKCFAGGHRGLRLEGEAASSPKIWGRPF